MSLEAPVSKSRKTNLKIYAGFCITFAIFFGYDGYFSRYEWSLRRSFYEKHVVDGNADDTMVFNRISPPFLLAGAAGLLLWLRSITRKKMTAEETELVISDAEKIPYDSIQKIDKTHFDSKGFFVLTYKDMQGREVDRKISDRHYDNLPAVLELLVAKIG